jgi:hypothetical protein
MNWVPGDLRIPFGVGTAGFSGHVTHRKALERWLAPVLARNWKAHSQKPPKDDKGAGLCCHPERSEGSHRESGRLVGICLRESFLPMRSFGR